MRVHRLLILTFAVVLTTPAAYALQIRSGQTVTVEKDVTIDDDLIVTGQDVTVNGTVTGNLLVVAQTVRIEGEVGGSVVAFARTIECLGKIAGSLQGAGETVTVADSVGRNLICAGRHIEVGDTAVVGRDALVAGNSINADGVVAGDLKAAGRTVTLNGGVGQTARFWVERLRLTDKARVVGDLIYEGARPALIAPGAKVSGKVLHVLPEPRPPRRHGWGWPWRIVGLVWLLLFTAGLVTLLPAHMKAAADRIRTSPWWVLLVGFLAIIVTPFIAFVLLLPVLPAGLMIGAAWLALLYVSKVVAGIFVGLWIFRALARREVPRPVLGGLLGIFVIWGLGLIPYLGPVVRAAAVVFGFGGLGMVIGQGIAAGYRRSGPSSAAGAGP
jgi:hypothetical protein